MNAESPIVECEALRDELLRDAVGDVLETESTGELEAHLSNCSSCRETLEESRELLDSLRAALRPTELPAGLQARIHQGWKGRTPRRAGRVRRLLPLAALAAAASLLVAVLTPPEQPMTLSQADAAEIASAFGLLQWNDPLERSLDTVGKRLDSIQRDLGGDADPAGPLPWTAEDDWDNPARDEDSSSQRRSRSRSVLVASEFGLRLELGNAGV